jgi:hypothetical protein
MKPLIAFAVAGTLCASPCLAAELPDEGFRAERRVGAVAGAYVAVPLNAPSTAERAPRSGLRLAMSHHAGSTRSFSFRREANLLDLRLVGAERTVYLSGRPITGPAAERLKAAGGGGGGGRLDKIMIGAGIALAAVAGVVIATSIE